jgi:hypothetical protein
LTQDAFRLMEQEGPVYLPLPVCSQESKHVDISCRYFLAWYLAFPNLIRWRVCGRARDLVPEYVPITTPPRHTRYLVSRSNIYEVTTLFWSFSSQLNS